MGLHVLDTSSDGHAGPDAPSRVGSAEASILYRALDSIVAGGARPRATRATDDLLALRRAVDLACAGTIPAEHLEDPFPRYLRGYRRPQRHELSNGLVAGPPDFIGVGAQKCGTSWWHALIDLHPDVHTPAGPFKEARVFSSPEWAPGAPFDAEAYAQRFARPVGMITGEWTPDYLWNTWGAPMLQHAAPDAKVLLLVRDPVERYTSAFAHMLMYDEPIRSAAFVGAYRNGLYGRQLKHLRRYFPQDQVLVLQYERCVADPAVELARTYAFLELNPAFLSDELSQAVHPTTVEKPILPPRLRERLVRGYRRDALLLAEHAPGIDLGLWPSLGLTTR